MKRKYPHKGFKRQVLMGLENIISQQTKPDSKSPTAKSDIGLMPNKLDKPADTYIEVPTRLIENYARRMGYNLNLFKYCLKNNLDYFAIQQQVQARGMLR